MMRFSTGPALSAVAALVLLAACTTKPQASAEAPPPASAPPPPAAMQSSIIPGSAEDLRVNVGDTVHFEYNKSDIRDEDRAILQRQAAWLQKYPQVRVTIEGNCDERGTREYNLALGARRAASVRTFLIDHGVAPDRITTVSYGKERPIDPGTGEAAWAHDRNAHTAITSGAD